MTRISTAAELDARLRSIRDTRGGEDQFVAEAQELGRDLGVRIGCDSLIRLALAGLTRVGARDRPEPRSDAVFSGRSMVLAPASATQWGDADADDLLEALLGSVAEAVPAVGVQGELRSTYVAVLARPDVRAALGADRPVDLHALAALVAERTAAGFRVPETLDLDVEVGLFDWLGHVLGGPLPVDFLAEALNRRDLRLALRDERVGSTAARLCEVPVCDLLPFEGPDDTVVDPPLSFDQLVQSAETLSRTSAGWAARHRGMLDPLAAGEVTQRPWVMSGRALRWLVDRGVPVGPLRLGRIDEYVKSVVEMLDRGEGTEPVGAHLNVVVGQAEDGVHLPLAEELALLAWLLDVHDDYVDLEALLDIRSKGLRGDFG
ncbi:hypothetical protein IEZ26_03780 [Nocardioides cavernae]|uniref:Uncharacterized protein n=1 Tax=Nocardioides cavernae TaxID=1921566 RepID=A0ABR8NA32_9ACTN|nr:hypothetical protein [Nocardioides cavernae]MBD3923729.1 hypothetical protein [Nocardioides cavernae]MBM7511338.1 hypothetical protein [Nocardioides cavernae]